MANTDQNTALPVRSEADGNDERMHCKIVDGKALTAVYRAEVDSDYNLHVEIHGNDTTGNDRVVRTSERGALTPDGLYDATNNKIPGNIGLIASTREVTPGDTKQTERLTSIKEPVRHVTALDVSLHDEAGFPYSETNPLPTTSVDSEGDEIHFPVFTPADIAKAGTANLDYPVTALKTLRLRQVLVSASGKIKAVIQTSVDGVAFVTKSVWFNSTANTNIDWTIPVSLSVTGTGSKVRVLVTNLDNQPQTIYATIVGYEV